MVKDVPIPKKIFEEFQPFVQDKVSVANLFDGLNVCVSCDKKRNQMPSQSKGHSCLDKYFTKVSLKESASSVGEMGKKNTNSTFHAISTSSESETGLSKFKNMEAKNVQVEQDDINSNEDIEFEQSPSKPIIAAMNALGKLKREISELNADDNSSRDSTALVIDEDQLESEKELQINQDEIHKKNSSIVSDNELTSSRSAKDCSNNRIKSNLKKNDNNENETLNFTKLFGMKNTQKSDLGKNFLTSTPVETSKVLKRKRIDSSEQFLSKKRKRSNSSLECDPTHSYDENLIEVKSFNEGECPLYVEDINSDDEIYVMQCPKEVEFGNLIGKEFELNGDSTLPLVVNGEKQFFECLSQKDTMGRHVNMILPSRKEGILKFGMYQLEGSILITESMQEPGESTPDEESTSATDIKIKSDTDNTREENDFIEANQEKRKKHKKRDNNSEIEQNSENIKTMLTEGEVIQDAEDNTVSPIKKKKKKKEKYKEEQISVEEADSTNIIKKKKKKKEKHKERNTDSESQQIEDQIKNEEEVVSDPVEKISYDEIKIKKKKRGKEQDKFPEDEQQSLPEEDGLVKKKKKKKHREDAEQMEIETEHLRQSQNLKKEQCASSTEEFESTSPVKKKKKKKDREAYRNAIIKEEQEELKRVSVERITESVISEEEPIKKKKKKNYKNEDNEDGENYNLSFDSETVTEEQLQKKKRKKKKKEKDKEFE